MYKKMKSWKMVKIWRSSYFCGICPHIRTPGVALDPLWVLSPHYVLRSVVRPSVLTFKCVF